MILHIKDKDAPIRELSLDQVKFEFRNKIISNSALYWKAGMSEWSRLDQLPEIKEISVQSPKEERLGENWLYRQIDARRHFSEATNTNQNQDATTKWTWVKILSSTGFILVYIFACSLFISAAITRNENHNPTLGFLLGLILFRRIFRLQSEKTITKKPDRSFSRFYLHASAWAFAKWFVYLIPVYIFAVLDAETSSYLGTNLGKCLGLYICTLTLGLDVPVWTWRKRNEFIANGYPRKNLAWAVIGGVGIPASIYAVIFLFIPAFQNSMERARIVSEAFEASKAAEAQTNATPAPWSPPEEWHDVSDASSGLPTESQSLRRVYGKSLAYSFILPSDWDINYDLAPYDLFADGNGSTLKVIYQPSSSKTALERLDFIRGMLRHSGEVKITNFFTKLINNIQWVGFSCTIHHPKKMPIITTCLAYKHNRQIFMITYHTLLSNKQKFDDIFNPIINSFEIR
jgi:hypothetical protein